VNFINLTFPRVLGAGRFILKIKLLLRGKLVSTLFGFFAFFISLFFILNYSAIVYYAIKFISSPDYLLLSIIHQDNNVSKNMAIDYIVSLNKGKETVFRSYLLSTVDKICNLRNLVNNISYNELIIFWIGADNTLSYYILWESSNGSTHSLLFSDKLHSDFFLAAKIFEKILSSSDTPNQYFISEFPDLKFVFKKFDRKIFPYLYSVSPNNKYICLVKNINSSEKWPSTPLKIFKRTGLPHLKSSSF